MTDYRIIQTLPGDQFWHYIADYSPQTIHWMGDLQDAGHYHGFLAMTIDNALLGLCVIDISPLGFGPLAEDTVGFLEDIHVLPRCRRQGIGTALLRAALEEAWRQGAQHVRWSIGYDAEALPFYRMLGFAFIPEEDPQHDPPERYYTVVATSPRNIPSDEFKDSTGTVDTCC